MLPQSFVFQEDFPRLPNGKVDRSALGNANAATIEGATKEAAEDSFEEPETTIEKVLASLWIELLKRPTIGRQDDFFRLGGHSILATQLFARIQELLGVKIRLRSLFEERTLQAIAVSITEQAEDPQKLERRAEIALQILELSDDETEQALGA